MPSKDTKKKKIIYIIYYAEVNSDEVKALMEFCITSINKYKPDVLYFLFSSPGGDVSAGVTLYNFFKAIPQKIIMHNIGSVDSIGTVIFLSGEDRFAMPHATFLFHGVETSFISKEKMDIPKIKEKQSGMIHDQEKIALIISENSSISRKEMSELFEQGETKSADFAKQKSFIHDIKSIELKKDDILLNFSFEKKQESSTK